jgi:hypothetical protein
MCIIGYSLLIDMNDVLHCVPSQGVRDLLKALLDKIQTIPNTVSSAVVQQLLAAREVRLLSSHRLFHKSLGISC